MQNAIDPEIMLSESYSIQADQAGEQLLHKGKIPHFKYLLLWAYKRSIAPTIMDVNEAQRRLKLKLKQNDVKILTDLLYELRELLQAKQNSWDGIQLNNYEKSLKPFYKSMIEQLQMLKDHVKQAGKNYTIQSLAGAVEACLRQGWCGDGDMCKEYTRRFLKLDPVANTQIAQVESRLNSLQRENDKLKQQQKSTFDKMKTLSNAKNYHNKNKHFNDFPKPSRKRRNEKENKSKGRKSNKTPIPFEGGPGIPPRNECIPGTNLRRVYDFCDGFQIDNCLYGDKCYWKRGHLCSYCGSDQHGRRSCRLRDPTWA